MSKRELGRRRVLAASGVGLATVAAGCGYQPGGGEFDWERSIGLRSSTDDDGQYSDGEYLYRIRNREGEAFSIDGIVDLDNADVTVYDSSGEIAWRAKAERQYQGSPAVADGTVYLHLEDGSVTALGRDDGDAAGTSHPTRSNEGSAAWTTPFDGPALELTAGEELVVGIGEATVIAFDAETGERRFSLGEIPDSDANGTESTDSIDQNGFDVDESAAVAVAGGRAWFLTGDELHGIDGDGTVLVDRSLPETGTWLAATEAGAVVAGEDELWVVDSDDDLALSTETGGSGTPVVVEPRDRVYHVGTDVLTAVDVDAGAATWRLDDYSSRPVPVADADGIYGLSANAALGGCEMFAVTSDGEAWWSVPSYDDLGCDEDLFLVGDRLVVFDGKTLYGFRKAPGSRRSVL